MAYDPNAPIPNDPYGRTPANFGFQTAINPQTGQEQFYLPASEIANISSQFGQGFIGDPSTWASQVQNADQEQGVYGTQDPLQYLQGLYRQTRDININPVLDPSTGGAFIDPATLGYAPRLDIGEKFPTGLKGALQFTGDVLTQTPIGMAVAGAGLGALGDAGAGDVTWNVSDSTLPLEPTVTDTTVTPVPDTSTPTNAWAEWEATQGTPEGSFPPADAGTPYNYAGQGYQTPSISDRIGTAISRAASGDMGGITSLIKDYPQYTGALLGFLKSGNLAGALAGASLGSGIGGLYNSYNALPGGDTNWVSSGLKTGLGLLGLASTPSTGLLGKPLGSIFGGTAAPGAGGAGVGAGGAGSAGAGLPGTIRPYQFTQIRNPNWGKPGEPYFIQQYSAQPTFRAANGGQIPDLDNMYPQSSIDHSSYATPLQRPVQQAVVSSGYGPRLNPFTGEEQMAGGGLADLTPTYAAGGRLLKGPGDGVSDSIPAVINGQKPQRAALADGEFVLPARIVSEIGNGSTEAGARKLYAMMDRIQKARGRTLKNVATDTRAEKLLPA